MSAWNACLVEVETLAERQSLWSLVPWRCQGCFLLDDSEVIIYLCIGKGI